MTAPRTHPLLVSAGRNLAVLALLVVAAFSSRLLAAELLTEHATLLGDPTAQNYFGGSISIDGARMAVGTSSNKDVYLFERTAAGWARQLKFTATFSNQLTSTVALDGDTLVVANEIYGWSGSAWTLQQTLPDYQGQVLKLQGDTLVVGAPNDGYNGTYPSADGAVYVYTRTGSTWTQQAKLTPTPAGLHESMGYRVALDGDTIVAGSDPFLGSHVGTYIFTRSGGTWTQQARLQAPPGGDVGWALAIEGDLAAVGNPRQNKVYLYARQGTQWSLADTVAAPAPDTSNVPYNFFGAEVALSNGQLAVLSDGGVASTSGEPYLNAHLFSHTAIGWVHAQRMSRRGGAVGGTLAGDVNCVALGQCFQNENATSSGVVEVWDNAAPPPPESGWTSHDVGATAIAGSDSESGGTVTVRGSGADIWDQADALHFRAKSLTGDGTLVARVANPGTGHGWSKVGLMFREDLSASARNAFAFVTPGNHAGLQWRADPAAMTGFTDGGWTGLPIWLMLDRAGDVFRAYKSLDGDNWTPMGSATVVMPATIYVGLAVSSHDNATLATATFDNVMQLGEPPTTPPPPPGNPPAAPTALQGGNQTASTITLTWTDNSTDETGFEVQRALGNETAAFAVVTTTAANASGFTDSGLSSNAQYTYRVRAVRSGTFSDYSNTYGLFTTPDSTPGLASADIGMVGAAGSTHATGGAVTLSAGGTDIWETADGFRFYYQSMQGDGSVTARVTAHSNSHPWSKAGVMIRESLAPGSANAAMVLTAGANCGLQTRASASAATEFTAGPWVQAVYWVRLTRAGNVFSGYVSADGANWVLVGSQTLALGSNALVGLAASAHTTSAQTTATFDNLAFPNGTPPPPPPPPSGSWTQQMWGTAVGTVSGSGADRSMQASGDDLWNSTDSGVFAYQAWTGDGEFIARVDALTNTHPWAKAGLMVRASADANSANAFVAVTPGAGVVFQTRATAGAESALLQQNWGGGPGSWLKLVRAGNVFTAYLSNTGGSAWTALGSQTITMPTTVLMGFGVSSHTNAQTTAAFSNFSQH